MAAIDTFAKIFTFVIKLYLIGCGGIIRVQIYASYILSHIIITQLYWEFLACGGYQHELKPSWFDQLMGVRRNLSQFFEIPVFLPQIAI